MKLRERQFLLELLASSEIRLLELVDGLTEEQWRFRERPERWSIAEIIEHCILFEEFVRGAISKTLDGLAEPEKRAEVAKKESLVLGLASGRSIRFNAREAVRPVGNWNDRDESIAALRRTRAKTLGLAGETEADLRSHFFPHIAFGDLDCYQWLVVLGQHAMRHALQIEEIRSDAGFPGS